MQKKIALLVYLRMIMRISGDPMVHLVELYKKVGYDKIWRKE